MASGANGIGGASEASGASRTGVRSRPTRLLLWALALFPWIDVALRLGGARLHLPSLVGRAWDEILLLAGLVWVLVSARRERRMPPLPLPVVISLLLFVLAALLSLSAGAVPPAVGLDALRVTFQPMLFGLVALYLLADPARRDEFVDLVVASGVAIALFGIAQYTGRLESPRWIDKPFTDQFRVVSIFANPNALGGYLAMILALALPTVGLSQPGRRRWAYAGACLVLVGALVFTFSRGAWIAFAAVALLYVAFTPKRLQWAGALALLTVTGLLLAPGEVSGRLAELFDPAYYRQSAHFGRLTFWSRALDSMAERPFVGTGLGMFGGSVALRHGVAGASWVDNHYLKLGAEIGLVGLGAFIALLAALFHAALPSYRQATSERARALALGICGVVVVVAVQSVTASVLEALYVGVHFYAFAGMLLALPAETGGGR